MSGDQIIRGYQQHGGISQVGVQAIGDHAHAEGRHITVGAAPDGAPTPADLLAEVRRLLTEHRAELTDAGSADTTADILGEELREDPPRRSRVLDLLKRLTDLVKPVKPVAEAVTELAKAVNATFGG